MNSPTNKAQSPEPEARSPNRKERLPTPGPANESSEPSEPVGLLAGSHWAEQEHPVDDDADSALGGEVASSTASLSSSILKYRTIQGRTYHSDAVTDQEYWGPNDEIANEMLDIFHHFMTLFLDGKLYTAPLKDNIQNALDVCTGTGLWAIDFADEYPNCNVYGTDISPIQPNWVPPNLRFDIEDVTKPWTYQENLFDYVHIRWLTAVVKDWPALYREVYKCMKPGGWLEHIDAEVNLVCLDDTMPPDTAMYQWGEIWSEIGRKTGLVVNMVDSGCMDAGIKEAGFTNIEVEDLLAPVSPWPADKRQKEIGLFNSAFLTQDIEGFLTYFCPTVLGWTVNETLIYAAILRREYKERKVHANFKWRLVRAQKPLDG
ncbi:hypothetical protein NCU05831 [Neurospora crassa OR74A]|uniref:S-adenosyl-L-methionine-dependent methyltransferase n=1 Tax=Neurospora crassa (strain ATCC 24698 / 74-OR23-1A / CBS 708.71 / DSM 1257 / FGSC 987) TaxID=367110 RepID=Q7S5L2_NEUCR|nr:hypothetical protein NCU05831 [Neurospora crassa OR74A]EAA30855.1 hypothetical protein NCU05831 [Neurospora crassa OR74A]|eukprot:XP_960091.1 hypothetical protein NCU05831 [Neurospora crassa OR74A]